MDFCRSGQERVLTGCASFVIFRRIRIAWGIRPFYPARVQARIQYRQLWSRSNVFFEAICL
jgi:hypothetical protein